MLFLRRLLPNEAWLLVFFYGILTTFFIFFSVTEVDCIPELPTVEKLCAKCVIECACSVQNQERNYPFADRVPYGVTVWRVSSALLLRVLS